MKEAIVGRGGGVGGSAAEAKPSPTFRPAPGSGARADQILKAPVFSTPSAKKLATRQQSDMT